MNFGRLGTGRNRNRPGLVNPVWKSPGLLWDVASLYCLCIVFMILTGPRCIFFKACASFFSKKIMCMCFGKEKGRNKSNVNFFLKWKAMLILLSYWVLLVAAAAAGMSTTVVGGRCPSRTRASLRAWLVGCQKLPSQNVGMPNFFSQNLGQNFRVPLD